MIRKGLLTFMLLVLLPTVAFAQDGGTTLPTTYKLDVSKLRHEYQGWNNCGPTTLTMGLSYFGYTSDQFPAATYMKPNREDKNVGPQEMADYVNEVAGLSINTRALYRPGGNLELIKTLLAANFPVIVEKGYEPEGYDWMGHYLLLIGYNDVEGYFYTYDSFSGHGNFEGLHEAYDHMTYYWRHFNNMFLVLYQPEREAELIGLLGNLADLDSAYTSTAIEAQEYLALDSNDAWAWFNIGDALTMLGRYADAASYFRVAFEKGLPWRTLWYRHTPFEAFYQTGQFQTVLNLIAAEKQNTPYVEEWYYYEGLVLASRGDLEGAKSQFNQALAYNSNFQPAREAIAALDNGTFQPVPEIVQ